MHPMSRHQYYVWRCTGDDYIRTEGAKGRGEGKGLPLRLLDCFLLVTPVVSEALAAFLLADGVADAVFLTGLTSTGAASGELSLSVGGVGPATASAMCAEGWERSSAAPALLQVAFSCAMTANN